MMIDYTIKFLALIGLLTCAVGGMVLVAISIYWYQRHIRDRFIAACTMRKAVKESECRRRNQ